MQNEKQQAQTSSSQENAQTRLDDIVPPDHPLREGLFGKHPAALGGPQPGVENSQDFFSIEEAPTHRVLIYLASQGLSPKDQCRKLGGQFDTAGRYIKGTGQYSLAKVAMINRQPWFRARLIEEFEKAGKDSVYAYLETQTIPSLETLAALRDTAKNENVRRQAAEYLLNRFLGKPTQPIKGTESSDQSQNFEDELAQLEQERERLRAETGSAN